MGNKPITAIVLAGGRGHRMNGLDKGLMLFKGKPIFEHLITCLKPQANEIMINANRNEDIYKTSHFPVFSDLIEGYLGPLAGIYSGLYYAKNDWVMFVSCDTPFIPDNLIERLWQALGSSFAAYVYDGERNHPTLLLIHKSLMSALKLYLDNGDRKLQLFLDSHNAKSVDFSDCSHCFININTPEELHYWNLK